MDPRWRTMLCLLPLAAVATSHAQLRTASVVQSGEQSYAIGVRTLKEIRLQEAFRSTVRQQYDFSCGSAALATLLSHHYGRPTTEQVIFESMYAAGDQPKIRSEGFSLLDMKRYLERAGFQADGFAVTVDELAGAKVPAIALIRDNGYNHFVVVKGIEGRRILLGDPSSGSRILSRAEFEALWQVKIFFVIRSHLDAARFNQPAEWAYRLRVPIGDVPLHDVAATAILMRRGPNDF